MKNKPHKHAELIKAWANGAEVEYLTDKNTWEVTPDPKWYNFIEYRIKPQPKLVPFDTEEGIKGLIGRVVISKETGSIYIITGVSKRNGTVCAGGFWIKPENLLTRYIFLDGSPCGKYEEESK